MDTMPMIFQTSTLAYDVRFSVYFKILGRCKASEIKTKFAEYVEKFVMKRGWKAIWSCVDVDIDMKENLNILVEVRVRLIYWRYIPLSTTSWWSPYLNGVNDLIRN